MANAAEAWLTGLASMVGGQSVTAEPSTCAALATGGIAPRCVAYPTTPESVAAALRFASESGLAVIPCRNTTKLSVGNPPRRYDIALSVKELNQVWRYEPNDLTVSVEPGMKLGDFQHFLARHQLWIPLDPPGGDRASLGGIVAANASGPYRTRYGAPRDMVLGLSVATTEGKIIKTGGRVVKNVAGYDLTKLFVGSFGTLGVIVDINLKLFPAPACRSTWAFHAAGLNCAQMFRRKLLSSPLNPLRAVLMDEGGRRLAGTPGSQGSDTFDIWIEFGGSERVIRRSIAAAIELARSVGLEPREIADDEARPGWQRITECSPPPNASGSHEVLLKAALPIDGVEEFLAHARSETGRARVPLACFAQFGTGIVRVFLLPEQPFENLSALVERLRGAVVGKGGSLVVERWPVEMGPGVDSWGPMGDDFSVMRELKNVWDPHGTLSPGRYVGGL